MPHPNNMNYKLSILIPSNRPDGLEVLLDSLKKNSDNYGAIQIIILVDDDKDYVEFQGHITTIHKKPQSPLSVGNMLHDCYKLAKGEWIFFCNDDVVCETSHWDSILFAKLNTVPDQMAVVWSNDNMLGATLSCFPIVSKKLLELVNFFPTNYLRYKIDDTLFHIMPFERRFYLDNIMFRHHNDQGETGFNLGDGRIYPIDGIAAQHDENLWNDLTNWRQFASVTIRNAMVKEDNGYKILIGVPIGLVPRFGEFEDYLNFLQKPQNCFLVKARGQSPARNRNLIIQQALDTGCTHVLFLDDDMAFKADLLMRLLAHDKDIVSALYFLRSYPHPPAIFNKANEITGFNTFKYLDDHDKGLIKITAAGFGAVLIKTDVFRKMEKPWVRMGELESDMWTDDIGFFNRVRKESTIDIWCDLDTYCGHAAQTIIWPNRLNGKWFTTYDTQGEGSISTPQVKLQSQLKEEQHVKRN